MATREEAASVRMQDKKEEAEPVVMIYMPEMYNNQPKSVVPQLLAA